LDSKCVVVEVYYSVHRILGIVSEHAVISVALSRHSDMLAVSSMSYGNVHDLGDMCDITGPMAAGAMRMDPGQQVSLLFQVNSDVKYIRKARWEESGVTVHVLLIKYGPLPHSASPVV
jgi:hypothetical protein